MYSRRGSKEIYNRCINRFFGITPIKTVPPNYVRYILIFVSFMSTFGNGPNGTTKWSMGILIWHNIAWLYSTLTMYLIQYVISLFQHFPKASLYVHGLSCTNWKRDSNKSNFATVYRCSSTDAASKLRCTAAVCRGTSICRYSVLHLDIRQKGITVCVWIFSHKLN